MEININYITDKSHISQKNNTSIHYNYREHNDTSYHGFDYRIRNQGGHVLDSLETNRNIASICYEYKPQFLIRNFYNLKLNTDDRQKQIYKQYIKILCSCGKEIHMRHSNNTI